LRITRRRLTDPLLLGAGTIRSPTLARAAESRFAPATILFGNLLNTVHQF